MAEDGLVVRTYGGCMLRPPIVAETPAAEKRLRRQPEKTAIAKAAIRLLTPGQHVYLDTGTTLETVAAQMPADFGGQILTANLAAAMALFDRFGGEVIVAGGRLGHHSPDLTGELATELLRRFRLDAAIVGADGIDAASGNIYAADLPTACLSRTAREQAAIVIVAADSSKFEQQGAAVSGTIHPGVTLVTDDGIAPETAARLRGHGGEVVIVDAEGKVTNAS